MICKIATSGTCHPSEVTAVEDLLKTELSVHNPHGIDSNILPVVTSKDGDYDKTLKQKRQYKEEDSENVSQASDLENPEKSTSQARKSRSKAKSRRRTSSSRSSSSSRYSLGSSGSSSRSSGSSSSRSRSRSKRRKSRSVSHDRTQKVFSSLTSEMSAKMKLEEATLLKEHEAAYYVYLQFPEMHLNYEEKYGRFLQSYKKKYNNSDESEHMTKMWHKYWKVCIKHIKTKEWKIKKKNLIEKCRTDERSSREKVYDETSKPIAAKPSAPTHKPLSSAEILMEITDISSQPVDDFTVGGALEILDVLSDKIGDIGPIIKNLVESVKTYGLKNKKSMDLISEQENVLSMNLTFERILNLCQTLNEEQRSYCKKGIAWGLQLIKYAKNFKEMNPVEPKTSTKPNKKAVRFDLNLFAQQTYNQDSNWVYSTLEESLEYVYGAKPDNDLVKQMFANISAIHLNMSASTPYLIGGASSAATPHLPPPSPATFATPSFVHPSTSSYSNFSSSQINSSKFHNTFGNPPPPPPDDASSFVNPPPTPVDAKLPPLPPPIDAKPPPPPPPVDEIPPPSPTKYSSKKSSTGSIVDAIMSLAKGSH